MADFSSNSANASLPVFLPPASPTQLLSYIIANHVYPTTLLIGSSKDCFLRDLTADAQAHSATAQTRTLLAASLFQTAVAKHIRVVFVPTVSHLRAYLAVFSPDDSPVPAPPGYPKATNAPPGLIVYGLLDLHRESSEWNAQGLMRSLSAVVDAASYAEFSPALIEPTGELDDEIASIDRLKIEDVPLLSYKQGGDTRLSKRAIPLGRIVRRWFRFVSVAWADLSQTNPETSIQDHEAELQDHEPATHEYAAMSQADE